MATRALSAGDRPDFIEGWSDDRALLRVTGLEFLVVQSIARAVDLSVQARETLGESYRDFKVGSAIMALDESGGRTGFYFAGNYTPHKGADWNCAEKRGLGKITERGFNRALIIAVAGEPGEIYDGIEAPTLHPCNRCQGLFEESKLVRPDTLVVTSNADGTNHELFTANSLIELHKTGLKQPFPADYHPMLGTFWRQILEFDADDEMRERAMMNEIYKLTHPFEREVQP